MGLSLKTATYLLGECSRSWLKASGEGVKMNFAVWSRAMGSEKKAFGLGQHRAHCPCHCWCSCPTCGCLLASQSSPKLPQHQGGFPECLQDQTDSVAFAVFLSVPLCWPYQLLVHRPGLMDGLIAVKPCFVVIMAPLSWKYSARNTFSFLYPFVICFKSFCWPHWLWANCIYIMQCQRMTGVYFNVPLLNIFSILQLDFWEPC